MDNSVLATLRSAEGVTHISRMCTPGGQRVPRSSRTNSSKIRVFFCTMAQDLAVVINREDLVPCSECEPLADRCDGFRIFPAGGFERGPDLHGNQRVLVRCGRRCAQDSDFCERYRRAGECRSFPGNVLVLAEGAKAQVARRAWLAEDDAGSSSSSASSSDGSVDSASSVHPVDARDAFLASFRAVIGSPSRLRAAQAFCDVLRTCDETRILGLQAIFDKLSHGSAATMRVLGSIAEASESEVEVISVAVERATESKAAAPRGEQSAAAREESVRSLLALPKAREEERGVEAGGYEALRLKRKRGSEGTATFASGTRSQVHVQLLRSVRQGWEDLNAFPLPPPGEVTRNFISMIAAGWKSGSRSGVTQPPGDGVLLASCTLQCEPAPLAGASKSPKPAVLSKDGKRVQGPVLAGVRLHFFLAVIHTQRESLLHEWDGLVALARASLPGERVWDYITDAAATLRLCDMLTKAVDEYLEHFSTHDGIRGRYPLIQRALGMHLEAWSREGKGMGEHDWRALVRSARTSVATLVDSSFASGAKDQLAQALATASRRCDRCRLEGHIGSQFGDPAEAKHPNRKGGRQ